MFISGPQFITLTNGHSLLMIDGYTFHKDSTINKNRYRCSARKKGCNAYVVLSEERHVIVRQQLNHCPHERPIIKSTSYGLYVKA